MCEAAVHDRVVQAANDAQERAEATRARTYYSQVTRSLAIVLVVSQDVLVVLGHVPNVVALMAVEDNMTVVLHLPLSDEAQLS